MAFIPLKFAEAYLNQKTFPDHVNVYSYDLTKDEQTRRNISIFEHFERKHAQREWKLNKVRNVTRSPRGKQDSIRYVQRVMMEKEMRKRLHEDHVKSKRDAIRVKKSAEHDAFMDRLVAEDVTMTNRGFQYDPTKGRYIPAGKRGKPEKAGKDGKSQKSKRK